MNISKEEIRREIACEFAYAVLYQTKHIVAHSFDPPWDSSGVVRNTHENFKLEDYENLKDFLCEYNGNTKASFQSGCGLFHDCYEDEFLQKIHEMLGTYSGEYFNRLVEERKEDLLRELGVQKDCDPDDLYEAFYEEIAALVPTCEYTVLENLGKNKAGELFKEGEFLAGLTKKRQEDAWKLRVEEEKTRAQKALKIFNEMKEIYFKEHGIRFDEKKKIEASNFKPFKKFWDKHFTKDEQALIPYYLCASNSVITKLQQGK